MSSIVDIAYMKHPIESPADLALVIRAVRKSVNVRQDDLAGSVGVSRQFAVDVERGKPTAQIGKVLALLKELGVALSVDIPQEAADRLVDLRQQRSLNEKRKHQGTASA
jgi:transcriptional regulator with XRE-family HTH domain